MLVFLFMHRLRLGSACFWLVLVSAIFSIQPVSTFTPDIMVNFFKTAYYKLEKKVASNSIPPIVNQNRIVLSNDVESGEKFDHSLWDSLLKKYVSTGANFGSVQNANAVDYGRLSKDENFSLYLDQLAQANVDSLSPSEQLALWMNAYNALCISVILKNGDLSIKSITEIKDDSNPVVWDRPAGTVGGIVDISLNTIEHEKLRNTFSDPSIHACIVCASASCPDLRREAYTGDKIQAQMSEQVQLWLQNPTKGCAVVNGKLTLSRIFLWFQDDFGDVQGVKDFCVQYVKDETIKSSLQKQNSVFSIAATPVRYFEYDWQMNRAP